MQSWYPARFEREMGCTEAELLRWLPGACGGRTVERSVGRAAIAIDAGGCVIEWHALPLRRIALLQMPRLAIGFRFDGVADEARQRFMRHFDLYTQRGGG